MKNFKKLSAVALAYLFLLSTLSMFAPNAQAAGTSVLNLGSLTIGCVGGPQNGMLAPQTSSVFANCTITVYVHGTSILAGVYSNATGSVVSNPISAGAGNQTYTFYAADGQYDVCVSNASSTPVLQSSCNFGLVINQGPLNTNNQKAQLTSTFTSANASGLQAITGLSFTFPSTFVQNVSFHCSLPYSQATPSASDQFGLAVLTTAPTRLDAVAYVNTSAAGAGVDSPLTNLTTTTPTAVATFTPASTVVYYAAIDGTVQLAGSGAATLQVYVANGTAANVIVIAPGAYCAIF